MSDCRGVGPRTRHLSGKELPAFVYKVIGRTTEVAVMSVTVGIMKSVSFVIVMYNYRYCMSKCSYHS